MKPTIELQINFNRVQEIIYWSKKWEISPLQIVKAFYVTKSAEVRKIEAYLRDKGFAV